MNDTMMQELLKRLDMLGEKLGDGAAAMWITLVRQAFWDGGVMNLCWLTLWLLLGGLCLRTALRVGAKLSADKDPNSDTRLEYEERGDLKLGRGFAIAGAVACGLISVAVLQTAVTSLVNPQYYALQDLAKMLTGK
jgi:hypothetical protein